MIDRRLAVVLLLLGGCATAVAPPPAVPPAAAPPATATLPLPHELHWARNSAEHHAVYRQTYILATRRLEELAPGLAPGAWAVELDADETVIDNSQYQKELAAAGRRHNEDRWREWVGRLAAPPLPGAVAFLRRVHELGGKIAIVTNRIQALCPATEEDFRRHEIPFDLMLCRSPETSEKEPRFEAVERGTAVPGLPPLQIVLYVGDNIRDFPGLDQDLRAKPDEAFAEFGTRFFVLPNPMYGSWEGNPPDE
jgi:5'-nucleotidase (lipoprotein e(P4) family)